MDLANGASAFAGIVTFDDAPINGEAEERLCRATTVLHRSRVSTRRLERALFVQRGALATGGGNNDLEVLTSRGGRTLFTASARLDNREELAAALGLAPGELAGTPDSALILRMFERWGEAGVARCLGAFSFALWDADARQLTLGRDCLGNRALFFHIGPQFVTFATTLKAMLAMPWVPREIDEITLANFMAVNLSEQKRTFYRGVERVPTRTLVTIDGSGVHHRHYWTPNIDAPPPYRREEDYVERARELLDQAVSAATTDTPDVAVSTSGGLDSSAVAATAARLGRSESITCFSLLPPPGMAIDLGPFTYLDERSKVEALARMHPALKTHFIAPEGVHPLEEDATRFFARTQVPTLGATNLGVFSFLDDAVRAAGHQVLQVGQFGDFGLSWRGNFSLLALLRSRQWAAFARELSATARESGHYPIRTLASQVLMPAASWPLRRWIHRLKGRDPDSVARLSALNPAFIAQFGLARQWRAQKFDPWFGIHGWNAAQYRANSMFDDNHFARDIMAMRKDMHGLEVRDPHRDRRLLEFLLTVPEPMFRQNGVQRSFARRVLADRLPREILDERRRGVQAPAWFRSLTTRRADIALELQRLEASPLAQRLIDLPRLKRLMSQWPKTEQGAQSRREEYGLALTRAVHVGRFIRWVEGGNA
jgi:asparagine synthase (glutamine-hydrolysing)